MNMIKIGKFIQEKRKEKKLTQQDLADILNISDRAISKWECGKSIPDSSIMIKLCEILDISVNELLIGGKIEMKNYNKQAELNLLQIKKEKEESDKKLLFSEIIIIISSFIFLFTSIIIGSYIIKIDESKYYLSLILFIVSFVQFIICVLFAIRIEQKAGYYKCKNCNSKHVPTYKQILFSMHINRTRYMSCPNCKKRSWQKKVISDD